MGLFGGGGGGGIGGSVSNALGGGVVGGVAGQIVDPLGMNSRILGAAGVDPNKLGGQIFGNGEDPGILGVGMFDAKKYDINEGAFKDGGTYDSRRSQFANQLSQAMSRQAPTVQGVQINQDPANQVRGRQMTLADQLTAQAAGQGPSLATMQLKQASDRNLANAMAFAASQRGGGGLALRNVRNQQTDIMGQAARDAAMARMQEQLTAREQLAGVLQGTRGQDLTVATSQAELQNAANLANQKALLEQQGLNDAQARFYNQGMMDLDMKQREALMALEKLKTEQQSSNNQARAQAYAGAASARGNLIGGVGSGIAAAFSDERLKEDVEEGEGDLDKFLKGFSLGQNKESNDPYSGQKKAGEAMGSGIGQALKSKPDTELAVKSSTTGVDAAPSMGGAMYAYEGGVVPHMNEGGPVNDQMKMLMQLAPIALMAMSDRDSKKDVVRMEEGGVVPGKAKVKGDSIKNDTVPAMLSPGEVVVPRTAAQDPEKLKEFVSNLKAYSYNYKNPEHGEGKHISPMAQDLEKSELGRSLVVDTPEGKIVNYAKAGGVMLATAAMLNQRMNELEKKVAPKHMFEGGVVEPKEAKKVDEASKKMADAMKKAFNHPMAKR